MLNIHNKLEFDTKLGDIGLVTLILNKIRWYNVVLNYISCPECGFIWYEILYMISVEMIQFFSCYTTQYDKFDHTFIREVDILGLFYENCPIKCKHQRKSWKMSQYPAIMYSQILQILEALIWETWDGQMFWKTRGY